MNVGIEVFFFWKIDEAKYFRRDVSVVEIFSGSCLIMGLGWWLGESGLGS